MPLYNTINDLQQTTSQCFLPDTAKDQIPPGRQQEGSCREQQRPLASQWNYVQLFHFNTFHKDSRIEFEAV